MEFEIIGCHTVIVFLTTIQYLLVFRKKDLYLIITQKLIFLKSGGFHEIWQISCEIHPKPYKIRCSNKNSSVWGVQGGGYDQDFMKSWS